ncbi:HP1 family phage holin [Gilliamella apicola]|uniref:HP1 family phage holin n=1 Tax=Gilliamella apicola TaxID=1196095 RepID=UPI001C0CC87D|nr:holin [Gilliamella apicola]
MDKYTSPVSYFWGVTCSMFGFLSLNDIAIIIGIIISIATFIINWIYKRRDFNHKKNLREQYYAKYEKNHHDCDL